MHHFESSTLGEALGADPIDENALTELSEEYLLMVHGGNSPSYQPSEASVGGFIVRQVIAYVVKQIIKDPSGPSQSGSPAVGSQGAGGQGGSGGAPGF